MPSTPERRRRFLIGGVAGAIAMLGVAYASVPLYKRFCEATGFNGAVRRGAAAPTTVALDRPLTVRFDTNVRTLPWDFTPDQESQVIQVGGAGLAYFHVTNRGAMPMTGRASYNVAPESAGAHLVKTQCFCFKDQTIAPGQTVRFPVVYYVEPKFATDPDTRAFHEIVISYTFFPSPDAKSLTAVARPLSVGFAATSSKRLRR